MIPTVLGLDSPGDNNTTINGVSSRRVGLTPEKSTSLDNSEAPIPGAHHHASSTSIVKSVSAQTRIPSFASPSTVTEVPAKVQTLANGSGQHQISHGNHQNLNQLEKVKHDQPQSNQQPLQEGQTSNFNSSLSSPLAHLSAEMTTTSSESGPSRNILSNALDISKSNNASTNIPKIHNSPCLDRMTEIVSGQPNASEVGYKTLNTTSDSTPNGENIVANARTNTDGSTQGSKMSLSSSCHSENGVTPVPRDSEVELESPFKGQSQLPSQPESQTQSPSPIQNKRKRESELESNGIEIKGEKRLKHNSPSQNPLAPQQSTLSILLQDSPVSDLSNTNTSDGTKPLSDSNANGNIDVSISGPTPLENVVFGSQSAPNPRLMHKASDHCTVPQFAKAFPPVKNTSLPSPRDDPAFGRQVKATLCTLVAETAIDSGLVIRLAKELQEVNKRLYEATRNKNRSDKSVQSSTQAQEVESLLATSTSDNGSAHSALAAQLMQKDEEIKQLHQTLSDMGQRYKSAVEMNQKFDMELSNIRSVLLATTNESKVLVERNRKLEAELNRKQIEKNNLAKHCGVLQNDLSKFTNGDKLGVGSGTSTGPDNSVQPPQSLARLSSTARDSNISIVQHKHIPIPGSVPSHSVSSEGVGAVSTTPTQSLPAGSVNSGASVSGSAMRAGPTGAASVQHRVDSPVIGIPAGHPEEQQNRGLVLRSTLQAPTLEIIRRQHQEQTGPTMQISVPSSSGRNFAALQQPQQQYPAVQNQNQLVKQPFMAQKPLIPQHEHVHRQQLHTHQETLTQTVNTFIQSGQPHTQIQRDQLPGFRRHSYPSPMNIIHQAYIQGAEPVKQVQLYAPNTGGSQQHRQLKGPNLAPARAQSASSVSSVVAGQNIIPSNHISRPQLIPYHPQNTFIQGGVVMRAFGQHPSPAQLHPQQPRPWRVSSSHSQAHHKESQVVPIVPTYPYPVFYPGQQPFQIPQSYTMTPDQTAVRYHALQKTQSYFTPVPVPEIQRLPQVQPQPVQETTQPGSVSSSLTGLPTAASPTVIDLTLDESGIEEAEEPPKKKQKIQETRQSESLDVASESASVDPVTSSDKRVVGDIKAGDSGATAIDEIDVSATITVESNTEAQSQHFDRVDISRPDIVETLIQTFDEGFVEGHSLKCCLFCKLRHQEDPDEWPHITRIQDPTVEDIANHLKDVHPSVLEAIYNGDYGEGEQEQQ